ncbi:histone-lysine N-methyltransferase SETMAR [Trichonephila clavipes]|uniref:Histone-lysine N-methyltransferase SETMAR n=1 Tax=Trichonephila clavipes TaxID=2585209 RepID=A0A8X7BJA0_TRICX|nr:histone-lysine N-methyltransferase SETMAR [Trichonephila clavipes]
MSHTAPTILRDFHRFRYLKHSLGGKRFSDSEEKKAAVNCCLSNQAADFFEEGFRNLILSSGIFEVKDAPNTGRPVVETVDKITEIINVDRHFCSCSITQELKMDHKRALNHLRKVGFKKKLDVWVPHQLTPKNVMDRIFICEALAKRNECDPFPKRMVTENEKWVTYDKTVQKLP